MSIIKNKKYKIFGMIVESEIPCVELEPSTGEPEVFIRIGKIPAGFQNTGSIRDQFFLPVKDVADFLITGGREIIIEPHQDVHEEVIRTYLLGSAFGALIHQRGLLPLHGSAITKGDFAIMISGGSGTGKSTLANAFINKDYLMLTDDVCVITLDHNLPFVHPGYPQMKLWKNTTDFFDIDVKKLRKIHPEADKYAVPVGSHYFYRSVPLKFMFILDENKNASLEIIKLKGIEKFDAIMNNIYRTHFISQMNIQESNFKTVSAVAGQIEVFSISRPDDLTLLDEMMKRIIISTNS
jgi:hypothetical protein